MKEKAANAKCRDVESTSAKKWEGGTVTKAFEMIVGRACEFKVKQEKAAADAAAAAAATATTPTPAATETAAGAQDTDAKKPEASADGSETATTAQTGAK